MEITYDTGAKVILQGPVTYEVESEAAGSLGGQADGETGEEGQWKMVRIKSEISNPQSQSLIPHSPLPILYLPSKLPPPS